MVWLGDGETMRRQTELGGNAIRVRMEQASCEEWEGGVETVLYGGFYRAGTAERRRSGSNPAVARWSLTPLVLKSNRGRGVDRALS
jgi:hypothetical protein